MRQHHQFGIDFRLTSLVSLFTLLSFCLIDPITTPYLRRGCARTAYASETRRPYDEVLCCVCSGVRTLAMSRRAKRVRRLELRESQHGPPSNDPEASGDASSCDASCGSFGSSNLRTLAISRRAKKVRRLEPRESQHGPPSSDPEASGDASSSDASYGSFGSSSSWEAAMGEQLYGAPPAGVHNYGSPGPWELSTHTRLVGASTASQLMPSESRGRWSSSWNRKRNKLEAPENELGVCKSSEDLSCWEGMDDVRCACCLREGGISRLVE